MAKRKTTTPRPSSMHPPRTLSTIPRTPTPSSALLAILASLVGSVHPFPVACNEPDVPPPSFLCPSLQPRAEAQDFALPPQTPPPSAPIPGPSRIVRKDHPTHFPVRYARRDLAPGYTQGPDGRWRKLSTWSLYGSTICICHDASSTVGTQPVDDLASTPAPSPPSETDFLPPGWSRMAEENSVRTIFILSLSLVLAALIAVFIFFLLWRRRRKHQLRKDLEKKLVNTRGSQENVESEKEHRAKAKLWARATTRWKENIRHSARRRRNARLSTTSLNAPNNSVVSLSRTYSSTHSPPRSRPVSLSSSRSPSPTPTTRSMHPTPSRIDHEPQNIHIEPPSPAPPSSPPLPPAYHRSHPANVPSAKDPAQLSSGSSVYGSHRSRMDSLTSDSPPPSPLESDTTPSSFHIAHVATDDKAVLQRMEVMGSRPPTESESSDVCGSAPILYEDDVRPLELGEAPEPVPSPIGFPLPPTVVSSSKVKAAALEYYDHDDFNVEPDPQPSAPPFEVGDSFLPSAPPEGETQPLPSAPPEIVDPDDDPMADARLPQEPNGSSVDIGRPGPSRPEPLPQYRP